MGNSSEQSCMDKKKHAATWNMPCFRFHRELETRPVFTELFAGGTRVFWASRGLISRDLGGGKVRPQLGFASKAFNVNLFWYVSPRKGENPLFSKHHRGLLLQTWGGLGGVCVSGPVPPSSAQAARETWFCLQGTRKGKARQAIAVNLGFILFS